MCEKVNLDVGLRRDSRDEIWVEVRTALAKESPPLLAPQPPVAEANDRMYIKVGMSLENRLKHVRKTYNPPARIHHNRSLLP